METYNYIAVFIVERFFGPEHYEEIGWTKHFVDEYPKDIYEDGDHSDELKDYAIKNIVRIKDFTKDTDCLCVNAKYYTPEEFVKSLKEPVCECHAYIYKEELKRIRSRK